MPDNCCGLHQDMRNAKISVVMPVFNSMRTLKTCLDAVKTAMQNYGDAELIVVDNGSTDGSYELVRRDYGELARIQQVPAVSIPRLRNRGARLASGAYLSFIDSDCIIPPDYFHRAMRVFAETQAAAAGCDYSLPPSPTWVEETWHWLHRRSSNGFVPYLYSGNLMVRKSVFDAVGGFAENLLTGEDAELGLRMTSRGHKIYRTVEMPAVHLGNPKTLGGFFRKQVWHSLGMFGSVGISWFDKTLLMTFAHLALIVVALVALVWAPVSPLSRIILCSALATIVPAASVTYRIIQTGRAHRPFRSIVLYHLYFAARVWVLAVLVLGGQSAATRRHHKYARGRMEAATRAPADTTEEVHLESSRLGVANDSAACPTTTGPNCEKISGVSKTRQT
jgi:cellulose synthase/poly-beta-1,6-N-acetylglucosamine synthase-like glycosyltransferase